LLEGFHDVTFGIHLCRGNQRSMWHREGTYDDIAERLLNELKHDRFLFEYDSPRAGGFEPLRFLPKGKVVVLGLVSTKVPQLEKIDDLKRRIDEASKYAPSTNSPSPHAVVRRSAISSAKTTRSATGDRR
jgi:5-methyltetrahydropteroyltriglutamate--homocysteine methyltransferase